MNIILHKLLNKWITIKWKIVRNLKILILMQAMWQLSIHLNVYIDLLTLKIYISVRLSNFFCLIEEYGNRKERRIQNFSKWRGETKGKTTICLHRFTHPETYLQFPNEYCGFPAQFLMPWPCFYYFSSVCIFSF